MTISCGPWAGSSAPPRTDRPRDRHPPRSRRSAARSPGSRRAPHGDVGLQSGRSPRCPTNDPRLLARADRPQAKNARTGGISVTRLRHFGGRSGMYQIDAHGAANRVRDGPTAARVAPRKSEPGGDEDGDLIQVRLWRRRFSSVTSRTPCCWRTWRAGGLHSPARLAMDLHTGRNRRMAS